MDFVLYARLGVVLLGNTSTPGHANTRPQRLCHAPSSYRRGMRSETEDCKADASSQLNGHRHLFGFMSLSTADPPRTGTPGLLWLPLRAIPQLLMAPVPAHVSRTLFLKSNAEKPAPISYTAVEPQPSHVLYSSSFGVTSLGLRSAPWELLLHQASSHSVAACSRSRAGV